MNYALILKAVQSLFENMPEDVKKQIDKEIDKMEDKYEEGSWKDLGMETAAGVLRGIAKIPDYPDEGDDAKDETESTDFI